MASSNDKNTLRNLAHDLNNLLASISNNAELLTRKGKLDADSRELVESIRQNAFRAADILDDAVAERGKRRVPRRINISLLIDEIVNSIHPSLNGRVTINVTKQKRLPFVSGIFTDLYRALSNIIINGIESIEGSGNIEINLGVDKNDGDVSKRHIVISVKDNGSGIAEDNLEKIFRNDFSTKTKKRESGLGLGIVLEVIENHNGRIEVESKINEGTEFRVYLPAIEDSVVTGNGAKKILVADDDKSIREVLAELLESYNYKVVQADNGTKLLSVYNTHPDLDLLIVDNKMPDVDGVDCIKQIRLFNNEVPIILSTGSCSEMDKDEVDELRLNAVLNKPYDFNSMLNVVDGLLTR